MSRTVATLPGAESDLVGVYRYLLDQAGESTADRFLDAIETTLAMVSKSPGIGHPHATNIARLAGLRFIPVVKFKRYLLFYLTTDDGLEVVRVIHGSRDVDRILDDEQDRG